MEIESEIKNWSESKYSEIPNDICIAVEPAMYGLNPDTSRINIEFGIFSSTHIVEFIFYDMCGVI